MLCILVCHLAGVIEYQHRGLPHAHLIVKLKNEPRTAAEIDFYVQATMPPTKDSKDNAINIELCAKMKCAFATNACMIQIIAQCHEHAPLTARL